MAFVTLLVMTTLAQTPAPQTAPPAGPQPPKEITVDANLAGQYNRIKSLLTRAADRMPADAYTFKPTADVRSFGANIAHTAATNFGMCANLTGKPSPKKPADVDKEPLNKDEATKLLAESFAFCDEYVKGLTAAQFNESYTANTVGRDGARSPVAVVKGGLLSNLVAHNNEMYGYTAVYLRLKGLVPPSSDPTKPPAK